MYLSVKGDFEKIKKDLQLTERKLIARARQAALRKTGTEIRKETLKKTASDMGLAQKFIRKRIKIFSNPRRKSVAVWFGLQKIRLVSITSQLKPRAAARFMKNVQGQPFMATMPSGHTGWYIRKAGSRHKPGKRKNPHKPELPIEEVAIDFSVQGARNLQTVGDRTGPRVFPDAFVKALEKQLARNRPYAR